MIKICQGTAQEAAEIASLIMEAMNAECCQYFYGSKHSSTEFHDFISTLVERQFTQYSYENTLVAVNKNHRVIGISVSYDGALLKTLRKAFIDGMQNIFQRDFSNIPDETSAGELYIDSLAIHPDYRSKGLGHLLLQATLDKALKINIQKVGLLVDDGNFKALKLYLSFGFRQIGLSSWGGHRMKHLQINTK